MITPHSSIPSVAAGLVLAGGRSSRMGHDKASLSIEGSTLLERAQSLLQATGCAPVWTSRNAPGFLNDLIPDAGPLGGIHAALHRHLHTGTQEQPAWCMVMPVDMPGITVPTLRYLLDTAIMRRRALYYADHFLPCVIPFTQATRQVLDTQLAERHYRVAGFLRALQADALPPPPAPILNNINTPADWQNLIASPPLPHAAHNTGRQHE